MNQYAPWVAMAVTAIFAMLGYMRIWGHVEEQLKHVSMETKETAKTVREMHDKMLTPKDIAVAIADVRIEILRDELNRARERKDDAGS